jgi:hypothetical protein
MKLILLKDFRFRVGLECRIYIFFHLITTKVICSFFFLKLSQVFTIE